MKSAAYRFSEETSPRVIVLHEVRQAAQGASAAAPTNEPAAAPLPEIDLHFDRQCIDGASTACRDIRADLESMPHILEKLQAQWKTRDLNTFIAQLLLDSRDGQRAGFPFEVAKELMFLAQLNVLIRAEETAPLLNIGRDEAIELIVRGDELALGHVNANQDVWSQHVAASRMDGASMRPGSYGKPSSPTEQRPAIAPKLVALLQEAPPFPPAVRLDVTTPRTLHSTHGHGSAEAVMDRGFFRCLAKELSTLHTRHLVLSSLGASAQCEWLAAGIRFTKIHCRFERVILHVDLLNTPEELLRLYIKEGLDHLVIFMNQASGNWRARAKALTQAAPDHFSSELRRLLAFRDEHAQHSGHCCQISVTTNTHRNLHAPGQLFATLSALPGLARYEEVLLPTGVNAVDAKQRGRTHCLAPFIEAHIRSNGHLVACAQDHTGASFAADLKQTTFTDAWLGQVFRKTRQRTMRGEPAGRLCEICPHRAPAVSH